MNEQLCRIERLRARKEINDVLRTRGRSGTFCVLYSKRTDGPASRFTVIVSRKIGKAVVRNRTKRRFREVFRRLKSRLEETVDIVVRAKPGIKDATYGEIAGDLVDLLRQKRLLVAPIHDESGIIASNEQRNAPKTKLEMRNREYGPE
ncbi:MAG: ribonuclease P protein component [Candidatus Omnitrophota bacterium]|nr:MAG: ribonuclease P protein component [Candidatus Omnitrophota bacterium]